MNSPRCGKHPQYTEQILARIGCFASLAPVAGAHHERLDGRGYYRGLSADQLSLDARLLTIADIFEAAQRGTTVS